MGLLLHFPIFMALCFVFISSLCIFPKMLMCHVVIDGQKTWVFCHNRIVAALYPKKDLFHFKGNGEELVRQNKRVK